MDALVQFVLKHVLVLTAQIHNPRSVVAAEAPQFAVPDKYLSGPSAVKLNMLIYQEAQTLNDVVDFGYFALTLQQVQHDCLHDVEEQFAFGAYVVVQASYLNPYLCSDIAQGSRLKSSLVEKIKGDCANLLRGLVPAPSDRLQLGASSLIADAQTSMNARARRR